MINSSSSSSSTYMFFQEVSLSLRTPIELIASSTSMCLSYGFFEEHISKQLLLIDFSWNSTKLTVVQHRNNRIHLGPSLSCSDLCGYSISSGLYDSLFSRIVFSVKSFLSITFIALCLSRCVEQRLHHKEQNLDEYLQLLESHQEASNLE